MFHQNAAELLCIRTPAAGGGLGADCEGGVFEEVDSVSTVLVIVDAFVVVGTDFATTAAADMLCKKKIDAINRAPCAMQWQNRYGWVTDTHLTALFVARTTSVGNSLFNPLLCRMKQSILSLCRFVCSAAALFSDRNNPKTKTELDK